MKRKKKKDNKPMIIIITILICVLVGGAIYFGSPYLFTILQDQTCTITEAGGSCTVTYTMPEGKKLNNGVLSFDSSSQTLTGTLTQAEEDGFILEQKRISGDSDCYDGSSSIPCNYERGKDKGGEGIHDYIYYFPKFKSPGGVEFIDYTIDGRISAEYKIDATNSWISTGTYYYPFAEVEYAVGYYDGPDLDDDVQDDEIIDDEVRACYPGGECGSGSGHSGSVTGVCVEHPLYKTALSDCYYQDYFSKGFTFTVPTETFFIRMEADQGWNGKTYEIAEPTLTIYGVTYRYLSYPTNIIVNLAGIDVTVLDNVNDPVSVDVMGQIVGDINDYCNRDTSNTECQFTLTLTADEPGSISVNDNFLFVDNIIPECISGDDCTGKCNPTCEAGICVENIPESPCDSAVWHGYSNCYWDDSSCPGEPCTSDVCEGDYKVPCIDNELDHSQTEFCEFGCENGKCLSKDFNWKWLLLIPGIGIVLLIIILIRRKW